MATRKAMSKKLRFEVFHWIEMMDYLIKEAESDAK